MDTIEIIAFSIMVIGGISAIFLAIDENK